MFTTNTSDCIQFDNKVLLGGYMLLEHGHVCSRGYIESLVSDEKIPQKELSYNMVTATKKFYCSRKV